MADTQQDPQSQYSTEVDSVSIFSNLWCGSMVGIAFGLVGHYLAKRILYVRRDAVLHGRTPPSIIGLIPQELYEMLKDVCSVFSCLFATMKTGVYASIRRLRPAQVSHRFWPESMAADQPETLPIPTPYIEDAGMRSGSTRDFRPVLPSHNRHLIESRRHSLENPRSAPVAPNPSESAATVLHQQQPPPPPTPNTV